MALINRLSRAFRFWVCCWFVIGMFDVSNAFAQSTKPAPKVIGRVEMTGYLQHGLVAAGGAVSGSLTKVDGVPVYLRILKEELRTTAERLNDQQVWLEGALTYEFRFDERQGDWTPVLLIKVDNLREPRELEKRDECRVTVRGQFDKNSIQFSDIKGLKWSVSAKEESLKNRLNLIEVGAYKVTGKLNFAADPKRWHITLSDFEPEQK